MESNTEDPFITRLKGNLKNANINTNVSISNIPLINRNVSELLNDEELSKKIGRMETILNYYEAKLKSEFNERKILEEKVQNLTTDIYHIHENLDNITKLFTDNFLKIKNNIIENVENKNNSVNKILLESSKRINTLEDILLNNNNTINNINTNEITNSQRLSQNIDNQGTIKSVNNSMLISTQRDSNFMKKNYSTLQNNKYEILLNKINKIEKAVFNKESFIGRGEEINMGLTKVNHLEKKFEIFLVKFNSDINLIKNNIKQNMDNIDNLNSAHNVLNEKYDNLYKTFNDTNININKFNYQTTIVLNETKKKLDEYLDYFNKTKIDLNKFETDINEDYIILKQVLNDKLNEYEKDLNDMKNNFGATIEDYKIKIEEKNEIFINNIQKEKDDYISGVQKIQKSIFEKYEMMQKENQNLNENINNMKNSFFHNLNEIEQYFNKKYQLLYKAINLQEN